MGGKNAPNIPDALTRLDRTRRALREVYDAFSRVGDPSAVKAATKTGEALESLRQAAVLAMRVPLVAIPKAQGRYKWVPGDRVRIQARYVLLYPWGYGSLLVVREHDGDIIVSGESGVGELRVTRGHLRRETEEDA